MDFKAILTTALGVAIGMIIADKVLSALSKTSNLDLTND